MAANTTQNTTVPVSGGLSDEDLQILRQSLPPHVKDRDADVLAYWRALPQLLAEGNEGRYALIHAGQVVSLWDTLGDAAQAGYDKFGADAHFMTSPVKDLELTRIRQFLAQHRSRPCSS
jgi:hypothetical protein